MRNSTIKAIGIAASVLGMTATALSDWSSEKTMEREIERKVEQCFNKKAQQWKKSNMK